MTGAGRSTGAGFWWAEALVLAALALVALAALASFRLCTGSLGCDGGVAVRVPSGAPCARAAGSPAG
jgi:hypothetical protein